MRPEHRRGILQAKPATEAGEGPDGTRKLEVESGAEVLLFAPASRSLHPGAPLVVSLHGAGGTANAGLQLLRDEAEAAGFLLLAPGSRGGTWDVIRHGYGQDVATIDGAMAQVFSDYRVDPARVAVAGFSDGASYALSLGLSNGKLFTHVIAFSPGFMAPSREQDSPDIFVSHGTGDEVLPIDRCSRRLVPRLRAERLNVCYREFHGPHSVPTAIRMQAVQWFLTGACGGE